MVFWIHKWEPFLTQIKKISIHSSPKHVILLYKPSHQTTRDNHFSRSVTTTSKSCTHITYYLPRSTRICHVSNFTKFINEIYALYYSETAESKNWTYLVLGSKYMNKAEIEVWCYWKWYKDRRGSGGAWISYKTLDFFKVKIS